jgi:hypothetical protein
MVVELELAPKQKRPAGEPCCEPLVRPDVERARGDRLALIAKALGDPIRLQTGYYYLLPGALGELGAWLGDGREEDEG